MRVKKYVVYFLAIFAMGFSCNKSESPSPNQDGQAGSLARFTLVNDFLYIVDRNSLKAFDATNSADPVFRSTVDVVNGVETIFPLNNNLFIGTTTGMFIYNIDNPATPTYVSSFAHVLSCDPVVADNQFAYVTLRGGSACGRSVSQLDILDITSITDPTLASTTIMPEPYGLSVNNDLLYVCNGDSGVSMVDVTDRQAPLDAGTLSGLNAIDVIVNQAQNLMIVVGEDGIHQYDVTNPLQPQLLSIFGN